MPSFSAPVFISSAIPSGFHRLILTDVLSACTNFMISSWHSIDFSMCVEKKESQTVTTQAILLIDSEGGSFFFIISSSLLLKLH